MFLTFAAHSVAFLLPYRLQYEEDRRWERAMRHRRGALLRALR